MLQLGELYNYYNIEFHEIKIAGIDSAQKNKRVKIADIDSLIKLKENTFTNIDKDDIYYLKELKKNAGL